MSFFNKMLASIGVGGAKVDTKLEKSEYIAGETIRGQVEVKGGNVQQRIDSIYLTLYTTYTREMDDTKYTDRAALYTHKLNEPFTIRAKEEKVIPFALTVPMETPLTYGHTRVWIATSLDIKSAPDPTDKDYIEIRPARIPAAVLKEMQGMGFRLREAECEQAPKRFRGRYPFVQEFEFIPVGGPFAGKLDEVEIIFLSQAAESANLLIQVDRKARGFGGFLEEMLEMDETYVKITIYSSDLSRLNEKLKSLIDKHS